MYCIMTVIYGVPLTEELDSFIASCEDENDDSDLGSGDAECCGFETMYSGSADHRPGFCGVELDGFDEACEFIDMGKLKLQPTPAQIGAAATKIAALDPRIKERLLPIGVYIIPSTS